MVVKLEVILKTRQGSMQKIGFFLVKSHTFWGKRSDLLTVSIRIFNFIVRLTVFTSRIFCINTNNTFVDFNH